MSVGSCIFVYLKSGYVAGKVSSCCSWMQMHSLPVAHRVLSPCLDAGNLMVLFSISWSIPLLLHTPLSPVCAYICTRNAAQRLLLELQNVYVYNCKNGGSSSFRLLNYYICFPSIAPSAWGIIPSILKIILLFPAIHRSNWELRTKYLTIALQILCRKLLLEKLTKLQF